MIDSNQRPLFKSASTDFIISNRSPMQRYSQIDILSKFSDLWPIYWLGLGHMSVMSLDLDLRKKDICLRYRCLDLRIGHQLEAGCRSESYIYIVDILLYLLSWWLYMYHFLTGSRSCLRGIIIFPLGLFCFTPPKQSFNLLYLLNLSCRIYQENKMSYKIFKWLKM